MEYVTMGYTKLAYALCDRDRQRYGEERWSEWRCSCCLLSIHKYITLSTHSKQQRNSFPIAIDSILKKILKLMRMSTELIVKIEYLLKPLWSTVINNEIWSNLILGA